MECTQDLHHQQQLEQQQYEEENGLAEGRRLRDEGIKNVSRNYSDWLSDARKIAYAFAKAHGAVTTDDVHRICPLPEGANHSLMGAVLRSPDFKFIGYTQSTRPSAHGRVIRIYSTITFEG